MTRPAFHRTSQPQVAAIQDAAAPHSIERSAETERATASREPDQDRRFFERGDWTLFRSLPTLAQKAGVDVALLPRVVMKEVTDNALDACGMCRVGLEGTTAYVEDDGPGIEGSDAEVAALFSIGRPLTSSKLWRLPTRGALGNGLRVVAGAVLATDGALVVATRGRRLALTPRDDGTTTAARVGTWTSWGTRIEVRLGGALVLREAALVWAHQAVAFAAGGLGYTGRTSPHWYDAEAFFELFQAAGERSVRDLVGELDGCSGPKAGAIAADHRGRLARDLSRAEVRDVLLAARATARQVAPHRLGSIGREVEILPGWPAAAYASGEGTFTLPAARSGPPASIPFVVEVWATPADRAQAEIFVNRTPVTSPCHAWFKDNTTFLDALEYGIPTGRRPARFCIAITTPFMPITNDGKAPDLSPMDEMITEVARKAIQRAKRAAPSDTGRARSQKEVIVDLIPAAAAHAGGDGAHRFSLRTLYYSVRPGFIEVFGKEPEYKTYSDIIADYEAEHGAIPGLYRDERGVIIHPHTDEEIPLGTLSAESYERPPWTFNKILYIEKKGFFPLLRDEGWHHRHDCALISAEGHATGAAKDVLDLLAETGEEITIYCLHDADGPGTCIAEALQEATRARPARKVRIVNLGLEPEEALAMGLQPERLEPSEKRRPVGAYVSSEWAAWLQLNRVELNAMSTPQFLEWLEKKFADASGKVMPPADVMATELRDRIRAAVHRRVLEELQPAITARVEALVAGTAAGVSTTIETLPDAVEQALRQTPEHSWRDPIAELAAEIADSAMAGDSR